MLPDNYYLRILAVDMGIQWIAWGFAAALKTERFYDLTGKKFTYTIIIQRAGSVLFHQKPSEC